MKHGFLDQYSDRDSFIHRLDPRTKFIISFLFILVVVLTPPDSWLVYTLYAVLITGLLLVGRLPAGYVLKRSLIIMPFVLLIALFIPFFKEGEIAGSYNMWLWQVTVTYSGIQVLVNIVIKSWLSILSLIWLASTTKLPHLLRGLEKMRLPRVMVLILSFMYRYLFIVVDEAMRMKQARDSRNFGGGRRWQVNTIGNMIGTLFIRSYERGERVYVAMAARGFDGHIRTLNHLSFGVADAYFGIGGILVLSLISLLTFLF